MVSSLNARDVYVSSETARPHIVLNAYEFNGELASSKNIINCKFNYVRH